MFINGLAAGPVTYSPGGNSAQNNLSTMLTAPATIGPKAIDQTAGVVGVVRAAVDPLGIQVTDIDPGAEPHLEIVLVGQGWPFSASYPSIAPFICDRFLGNMIGFVNAVPNRTDADLAGSVLFVIGVMNGLAPTWQPGNCVAISPAGGATCTYANQVPISTSGCSGTTQDQLTVLTTNLGCP